MKRLEPLSGFGTQKRKNLFQRFQTPQALLSASVDDIAKVEKIGRTKAVEVHKVLHGEMVPQKLWAGKERVVLWNTLTKKKVSGAAAPTVDKADAWLTSHPHYERYSGQDQQQKSELHVPEQCKMPEATYEEYCSHPTGNEQQLQKNLREYNLRLGPTVALPPSTTRTTADDLRGVILRLGVMHFGHVCHANALNPRRTAAPTLLPSLLTVSSPIVVIGAH